MSLNPICSSAAHFFLSACYGAGHVVHCGIIRTFFVYQPQQRAVYDADERNEIEQKQLSGGMSNQNSQVINLLVCHQKQHLLIFLTLHLYSIICRMVCLPSHHSI